MIYLVLLTFTDRRAQAGDHMAGHKDWIDQGFADGAFLSVGSLTDGSGGAIIAQGGNLAEMEARLAADPFVIEGIVIAHVHEVAPTRMAPPLQTLLNMAAA